MTIIFMNRLATFWTGIYRWLSDMRSRRFSSSRGLGAPAFGRVPVYGSNAAVALRDREVAPSFNSCNFSTGEAPDIEEFSVTLENSCDGNAVDENLMIPISA